MVKKLQIRYKKEIRDKIGAKVNFISFKILREFLANCCYLNFQSHRLLENCNCTTSKDYNHKISELLANNLFF